MPYPYDFFQNPHFKPATCFVLMPFQPEFDAVYQSIRHSLWSVGISVQRADQAYGPHIMENILNGIRDAEYVIVDITGCSPNVMYELGIAHTVKPANRVFIISQNPEEGRLPFNIVYHNTILYNVVNGLDHLKAALKERIVNDRTHRIQDRLPVYMRLLDSDYYDQEFDSDIELGVSLQQNPLRLPPPETSRNHLFFGRNNIIVNEGQVKIICSLRHRTLIPDHTEIIDYIFGPQVGQGIEINLIGFNLNLESATRNEALIKISLTYGQL